ncbi:DNA polymerase III subunit alpha [Jeotgalibacillus sp. R-1-5s-1]|uniref:DNA polymerase III subunit alpha n=1 Tax=Jeotgalibacillus sp. R-1-5s-1 TaxID=2555897 RepID=UPI00106B3510|nr:DNA polymerase III subunit alpha [Jeotgalibacillus sp. R-1-5s-1]TFD92502.1 DNA polymerase III subunit alpha [Jeotgalibacillus sp. R-1-5s-1]
MSFVHLQVLSSYSLLSSTITIPELIRRVKEQRMSAVALTDHNAMYGMVPFYKACKKEGIKPIAGLTADIQTEDGQTFPLVLLAENQEGFRNLIKISSAIQTASDQGLPIKWLKSYRSGLIALTPGTEGEIEHYLETGNLEKAMERSVFYSELFGEQHFYLSLQAQASAESKIKMADLSEKTNIPLAAAAEARSLSNEEKTSLEALFALRDGLLLDDVSIQSDYSFRSAEQAVSELGDYPEALEQTLNIAARCHFEIDLEGSHLPVYPLPDDVSSGEVLSHLCKTGLGKRVPGFSDVYRKRLEYELQTIERMGFNDYFLIVWDFMKFARDNQILTGPGRGSAAGSLVAYALYITHVDPIEHGLLFERFLNPERITLPDIDIDFPDHRRDEVIQYTAEKYGIRHVAQIVTFGTLSAKAAARDTARVFGMSTGEMEVISRSIPSKPGIKLDQAFAESEPLRRFVNQSARYMKWFETAKNLEGLPRHTSTHAAGVIISGLPLAEIVPLQKGTDYAHLTQWPMGILEEIGLLKMDFLGLRNLTILERVIQSIKKANPGFTLDRVPFDDSKTFELLGKGWTSGVFQFETEAMQKVLTALKPTEFEDLVAVNALNRPGPMEFIPQYIRRKYKQEETVYLHEDLVPILKPTFGIIVYQEQIMRIAAVFAGFSLGQADMLRRAVSKKKKEDLDRERSRFVEGSVKKGYTAKTANELYDLIVRFADYGFNRSHAVAYSIIAYQLAYLKANYPAEFMAALMTTSTGNEDKLAIYIRESKRLNILIQPPSINHSMRYFKCSGNSILFSLSAIKGISSAAAAEIIEVRKEKRFIDLFDFCARMPAKYLNRKFLESLVLSGALDEFGKDRSVLLATIDVAIEHASLVRSDGDSLFEDLDIRPKHIQASPMPAIEKLTFEKEVLGIYLSAHPLSAYQDSLKKMSTVSISELKAGQKTVTVGVLVSSVRVIRTKKGENMCFALLGDETGDVDAVAFPEAFRKYSAVLQKGQLLVVKAKIEDRDGKLQLILQQALPAEQFREIAEQKTVYLRIPAGADREQIKLEILALSKRYRGNQKAVIFIEETGEKTILQGHNGISADADSIAEFKKLLGSRHVVIQ